MTQQDRTSVPQPAKRVRKAKYSADERRARQAECMQRQRHAAAGTEQADAIKAYDRQRKKDHRQRMKENATSLSQQGQQPNVAATMDIAVPPARPMAPIAAAQPPLQPMTAANAVPVPRRITLPPASTAAPSPVVATMTTPRATNANGVAALPPPAIMHPYRHSGPHRGAGHLAADLTLQRQHQRAIRMSPDRRSLRPGVHLVVVSIPPPHDTPLQGPPPLAQHNSDDTAMAQTAVPEAQPRRSSRERVKRHRDSQSATAHDNILAHRREGYHLRDNAQTQDTPLRASNAAPPPSSSPSSNDYAQLLNRYWKRSGIKCHMYPTYMTDELGHDSKMPSAQ
jgi:hypothetical protein